MAYANNYTELKNGDGTYSKLGFIKRSLQLWSLDSFNRFKHSYFPNIGLFGSIVLFLDAIWCSIIYKAIYDDYFDYRFWEKSHYARKRFVTKGKSRKIQKLFNKKGGLYLHITSLLLTKNMLSLRQLRHMSSQDHFLLSAIL